MIFKTLASTVLLSIGVTAAANASILKMQCQQNLSDGRILVANGNLLPDGMGYNVIEYAPSTANGGWSYGECLIGLRRLPK